MATRRKPPTAVDKARGSQSPAATTVSERVEQTWRSERESASYESFDVGGLSRTQLLQAHLPEVHPLMLEGVQDRVNPNQAHPEADTLLELTAVGEDLVAPAVSETPDELSAITNDWQQDDALGHGMSPLPSSSMTHRELMGRVVFGLLGDEPGHLLKDLSTRQIEPDKWEALLPLFPEEETAKQAASFVDESDELVLESTYDDLPVQPPMMRATPTMQLTPPTFRAPPSSRIPSMRLWFGMRHQLRR